MHYTTSTRMNCTHYATGITLLKFELTFLNLPICFWQAGSGPNLPGTVPIIYKKNSNEDGIVFFLMPEALLGCLSRICDLHPGEF